MTRKKISPRVIRINPSGKPDKIIQKLLEGRVLIEECLNGYPARFNTSSGFVLFGERVKKVIRCTHGIKGRYAIHDVYSIKDGKFTGQKEKKEIITDLRRGVLVLTKERPSDQFFEIPVLESGTFNLKQILSLLREAHSACFTTEGEPLPVEALLVKPAGPTRPEDFIVGKLSREDI